MPSSLRRAGFGVLACFLASAAAAHDHAPLRGRLVFADHEKPVVRILDLDSGEVTHSFDVPKANPGFAGVAGGRYVVVKTGDEAGTLRILDTGLIAESHGDHVDLDKATPKLLDFATRGDRPAHVISGQGQLALFYDGLRPWEGKSEPKAVLIAIDSLARDKPDVTVWPSPAPQHGIAVPLGGRQWLMSVPNPAYARGDDRSASPRPNGFEILEQRGGPQKAAGWKQVARLDDPARADASCKLYHGYAPARGGRHILGCAEGEDGGLFVLSRAGKGVAVGWSARKLAYPDERRVSALKSREGGRHLVGNYGLKAPYDALLRIDPEARALTAADILPVPGGQAVCQFELNGNASRLANLTPDGKLRIYEVAPAWKELAAFDAVAPFDCAYGAKTPTPGLAVLGSSAFVSDPTNGRIREYHLDTLKQGLDMPVGGMPANLAASDAG
ncbi:hypothetical protein [Bosea minatitlanensis]|uniref:Uncharacterized protein n=1 Tax=Bosea minatitlanensis TaxID=128782 RepID=A0ABW0F1I7_9HYPH|nr:hypothetical protein [Bosea minatitlanensis]MCT4491986.1 hypothetical protein [Bosea minatitlanensis]